MRTRSRSFVALFAAALLGSALAWGDERTDEPPVDFAREVLPILSNKCFVCHGPDVRDEDQLRLDSFAAASADRGGYRAVDPETPEASEVLARIHSAEAPMPPEDAEKPLTEGERAVLARWIRQGGKYAMHWAFERPRKTLPAGVADRPASDVVDAWIESSLRTRGIEFAAEADRPTLARRAALVLTGLPPEPDVVEEFLADPMPDAYERLVEKLLSSPRYGEHQARYWLDAVRYGDTHGLHLDNRRGIYPYRDWVVYALNRNLPFDEFITWQLAGDLLPNPTLEQRVATGFVRLNPTTSEGGAIPAEFQCKNNFDRVETLGTVLLGMSLTCARCHTHKYDPIPQTEYYQLLAFFNSTSENSMDGNAYEYGPVLKAPQHQAAWQTWSALEADRNRLLTDPDVEAAITSAAVAAYAAKTTQWTSGEWRVSEPVAASASRPSAAAFKTVDDLPAVTKATPPASDQAVWVVGRIESAIDQTLWLSISGGDGSQLWIDGNVVGVPIDEGGPQAGTPIRLEIQRGSHEFVCRLVGAPEPVPINIRLRNAWQSLAAGAEWSNGDPQDRLWMLADMQGPLAEPRRADQAYDLARRIEAVQAEFTTTLVAADLPTPRETRLLTRGEYNMPVGDPLEPGTLAAMGPFPEAAPRNRLGLAQWLTSREHPLVARVLVNRIWQRTFGEGLVRTPEDFGVQGQYPTHPELLDWLAVEFQDSGWDLKHMLRLLVTCRTFRQHSAIRDDVDDPANRLFARGPRFRLDAEVIRDVALWASELLDPHQGGEGVKPYQPDGMWKALAHPGSNTKQYVRDKGQRLYRRSLYVYWKRTSPHPMMTLFDAPDRESSCVRRSRTNTSLQSLGLFNETQRIEMSRKLAERLLRDGRDDAERFDLLFKLLACRVPTDAERSACRLLLQKLRSRYEADPEDAVKLLSVADAPRDESLQPAEHAAWTQVAVTVLASDVALMLY